MSATSSVRRSSSQRTDEVPSFEFVSSSIRDELNSKVRTDMVSGSGVVTNWHGERTGFADPNESGPPNNDVLAEAVRNGLRHRPWLVKFVNAL